MHAWKRYWKWPTEDQAELLGALFGLVSPAGGELEAQWVKEFEDRCAAIDSGEIPLISADLVMAKDAADGSVPFTGFANRIG